MKKEENELNAVPVKPKNESRGEKNLPSLTNEFKCSACNELFICEVDFKKHERSHTSNGVKSAESMNANGIIIINESSDSDEERTAKSHKSIIVSDDTKVGLKKEETTEEKFIVDDEMIMNDDSEINLFQGDSSDQFNFNFNDEVELSANFLDDENPLADCEVEGDSEENEPETAEIGDTDQRSNTDSHATAENHTSGETDGEETEVNDNSQENEMSETQDDTCDDFEVPDETVTTEDGNAATIDNSKLENDTDENYEESVTSADKSDFKSKKESVKATNHTEKEEEDKDVETEITESKRPLSRESTASTASSSSERMLTIRSASQVNKMVAGPEVIVKTEKESISSSEKTDKPGLSILNPSQLGATEDNAGGENLLQSGNFVQSGDQMMGFMSSSLQNGVVPMQCDVCDAQFPDNILLEDHRALVGHYKCHYSPECANFVFQSIGEFTSHQQTIHGVLGQSPVQQLAHQVQNLPMRYSMDQPVTNNYQTYHQPGPAQVRPNVPQMYSQSQNNVQIRQYNVPGSPRLQIGAVRGSVVPNQINPLKRGIPPPQSPRLTPPKRRCPDTFPIRNGDADCKVVSVQKPDNTDDVVAQLSKSITITARQENQKKNDTAAVANMLANRGITVSSVPTKQNRNSSAVTMLNLNSAVSLIPTTTNKQNTGFAVPQGRLSGVRQPVPGRMQTVDLTGPDPPRNKQPLNRSTNRFTCQVCDRTFFNQEQLNQHMISHRSGVRRPLPFKCNLCGAQYPTQQGLIQHKQTCRRDAGTNEMVIPIVDLKQTGTLQRLQAIGINQMIPLSALGAQASNGTLGIPILPFSSDRTTISNLTNCGISNILPVGPLKSLGR